MLFNSLEFLFFFPIVFVLYWFCKGKRLLQNVVLLIASCIFYAWVDWRLLFLIGFTAVITYFSAPECRNSSIRAHAKYYLIGSVTINLLILAFFKYYNFFADSFSQAFHAIGLNADIPTLHLILPIGISFYTFKAISFSVDVYKGKIERDCDLLAFLCYLMFFPQLLAGPIEKARDLYPQFLKSRTFSHSQAVDGSKLIIWGLFKKIVIADTACSIVNLIYGNMERYNASALIICAFLYTFQIYGDFSGYSDMAVGIGKLLGIESKKNFNLPYLSRDIAEFWKRWHISLNTWFVEYVYIPLGGSRISKAITIRNTFIIFLLSGFWHGANWTFICWGLYHALLFVPLLLLGAAKRFDRYEANKRISSKEWLNIVITFIVVSIGWIIFRASDMNQAFGFIGKLFDITDYGMPNINPKRLLTISECLMAILFVAFMEVRKKTNDIVLCFNTKYRAVNWAGYLCITIWTILFYAVGQTFIYFQF